MHGTPLYSKLLKDELSRRAEKNPHYSLRAFARSLSVSPGSLSLIFSGRRVPSTRLASKLMTSLNLSPEENRRFLQSVAETQRGRKLKRGNSFFNKFLPEEIRSEPILEFAELKLDLFQAVSDWYHYAIMMLMETEGAQISPRWIAKELGITPLEARLGLDRLLRLGILRVKGKKLAVGKTYLTTADKDVTSPALKRHQKQILEKAIFSLENDPIEKRSMTSLTMAVDPERVPKAKEMIEEFNQKLCRFLEGGERRLVYQLGVCLFPIQKGRNQK